MSISQIQPQKNFAFVRQLPDPSDSTTYYVQTEIRNAESDALIERVNLTDKGNRRFVGIWRAIADKNGQGTLISVRTTVYTDSNYSTKSTTYGEEMETYLIMQQFNPREIVTILGPALFERGGGADVNYKKIREILKEEIAPVSAAVKEIDTSVEIPKNLATTADIAALKRELPSISDIKSCMPEMKEYEKIDLSPLMKSLEEKIAPLAETMQKIFEATKDKTDLEPVMELLKKVSLGDTEAYESLEETIKEKIPDVIHDFERLHDLTRDVFTYLMSFPKEPVGQGKKDYSPDARAREIMGMPD